jgi:hypothetical protein
MLKEELIAFVIFRRMKENKISSLAEQFRGSVHRSSPGIRPNGPPEFLALEDCGTPNRKLCNFTEQPEGGSGNARMRSTTMRLLYIYYSLFFVFPLLSQRGRAV